MIDHEIATTLWLTLKLAAITTTFLLLISTPFAWWLANNKSRYKPIIEALVALPLVLPPTVLGFYLLIAFSPQNALGESWLQLTGFQLAFSFTGLVIGSMIYSLPFVVQPLQATFQQLGHKPIEAATLLGAGPFDRFKSVILPLSAHGFLSAGVLGFAHTIGEFGVVLMIGGNIPGETQVASILIFDQVESLAYDQAHLLSGILLFGTFALLLLTYSSRKVFFKH